MNRPLSLPACWQTLGWSVVCALVLVLSIPREVGAQAAPPATEISRQVKAAYLYKFTSFAEWPSGAFANPTSPVVIGVMGDDTLAGELEQVVASRTVNGRPLSVRKLRRGEDSLDGVHMLFVGRVDKSRLAEMLATLKGRPILTVTDADDALTLGSMINFVVTGERLRFEVALATTEVSRIKISALMLAAAYRVVKEPS
ncbi:MAG: YfiR family protein [Rhodoferax sp.]|nr:YfiR family protein [Rhodoferax sp.]MDP3651779.1 YfiR family protein [Rhodoferax sp.]